MKILDCGARLPLQREGGTKKKQNKNKRNPKNPKNPKNSKILDWKVRDCCYEISRNQFFLFFFIFLFLLRCFRLLRGLKGERPRTFLFRPATIKPQLSSSSLHFLTPISLSISHSSSAPSFKCRGLIYSRLGFQPPQ